MSDMASNRITLRVPDALGERLRQRSRLKGKSESALVRAALEIYFERADEVRPAYELAQEAGILGCIRHAPRDLSTNRQYFEGFGR